MSVGNQKTVRTADCVDSSLLAALAEGRLEGRKRDKVEIHLGGCDHCRLALRRIEAAREAMRAVAEWVPPQATASSNARLEATLRWTRIDAAVEKSEPPRLAFFTPRRISYFAVAAAAATVLSVVGWSALRHRGDTGPAPTIVQLPQAPAVTPAPAPPPPAPAPVELRQAAVTLVGGDVRLVAMDGSEKPLDPRQPLREGDHIVTGSDGRIAFQWGEGSGALLEQASELRLSHLMPRSQELALARGRISVRVGPHQPGESMRVRAPDHTVTVHGTWFIVGVQPRGTSVEVLEGVVEVSSQAGDAAATRLPAPSRATFHRGSGIADDNRALSGREAATLRAQGEMGLLAWSSIPGLLEANGRLHLASDPPSQLVIDGVPFGATPLDVLRPRGRHLVELSRAGFATVRKWIALDGESDSGEWKAAMAREELRSSEVPPTAQEVNNVRDDLQKRGQHCLERILKRDPTAAGSITLKLQIGPAGQVLSTAISHDTLHEPQFNDCFRKGAAGWLFESARNAAMEYTFVGRAAGTPASTSPAIH